MKRIEYNPAEKSKQNIDPHDKHRKLNEALRWFQENILFILANAQVGFH